MRTKAIAGWYRTKFIWGDKTCFSEVWAESRLKAQNLLKQRAIGEELTGEVNHTRHRFEDSASEAYKDGSITELIHLLWLKGVYGNLIFTETILTAAGPDGLLTRASSGYRDAKTIKEIKALEQSVPGYAKPVKKVKRKKKSATVVKVAASALRASKKKATGKRKFTRRRRRLTSSW